MSAAIICAADGMLNGDDADNTGNDATIDFVQLIFSPLVVGKVL